MNKKQLINIGKFLTYVLRHKPDAIGISLDDEGWAKISDLIENSPRSGYSFSRAELDEVVAADDKGRFGISDDGLYIRARQGHSNASISISHTECTPPNILFHGTAKKNLQSIHKTGLVKGARHHVHLTVEKVTAEQVGKRYGEPVLLKIDAKRMIENGYTFFVSENNVWLTDNVPPEYLTEALD